MLQKFVIFIYRKKVMKNTKEALSYEVVDNLRKVMGTLPEEQPQ